MHETRKWSSATRRITVESWITQVLKYRRQPVQCVAYCEMMMMMIIIITTTIIIIIISSTTTTIIIICCCCCCAHVKFSTCVLPGIQQQQSVSVRLQHAGHNHSPCVVVHAAAHRCHHLALRPTVRESGVHRWAHPRYIDCSYNTQTRQRST